MFSMLIRNYTGKRLPASFSIQAWSNHYQSIAGKQVSQCSKSLSCTSPEAGFTYSSFPSLIDQHGIHSKEHVLGFSNSLEHKEENLLLQDQSSSNSFHKTNPDNSSFLRSSKLMGMAISTPESALGVFHAHQLLNQNLMLDLLSAQEKQDVDSPLPTTLQQALSDDDCRAIVVTDKSAPFKIVGVNSAWVHLCGYTKDEAKSQSLDIIQGPGTCKSSITAMMMEVLQGNQSSALVTNYRKNGRKFFNRVRVGPLGKDVNGNFNLLVGILEEVNEEPGYFQIVNV